MKKINICFLILSLIFILCLPACNKESKLNVFENIEFNDKEFIYDGEVHSIYVTNVPSFAIIAYQGNKQKEIGTYTVVATIKADGYETYTISAQLTIIKPIYQFENIEFNDQEFIYDGNNHSIYVTNVPSFATVTYQGNEQKEIGTYTVVATIEADGYETYIISASITIIPPSYQFENIEFNDQEFIYDGEFHSIVVEGELPEGTTITYKSNNNVNTNSFKEVGIYYITATVECEFYNTITLTATLKIIELPIITTDSNKEEFIITEDLNYDTFLTELKKHNFICYEEFGTQQKYENGDIVYTPHSYHTYVVCENKYYVYNDYIEEDEYIYDTIEFVEVVKDQALITKVKVSDDSISYYKIPKEAFYETFGGYYIEFPFTHLSETSNGGFEPKDVPAYYKWYSNYEIKDNTFNVTINNYIYHPEFTNSEVSSLTYYNIGNVDINIPNKYKASYDDIDKYDYYNFTLNGIDYLYYDETWEASIDISLYDIVLITPREITILPTIYDLKVDTIDYPYYIYNKNYSGYIFNVYFNEYFEYQGDYINNGSLKYGSTNSAISKFENYGGVIKYYGEWDNK